MGGGGGGISVRANLIFLINTLCSIHSVGTKLYLSITYYKLRDGVVEW